VIKRKKINQMPLLIVIFGICLAIFSRLEIIAEEINIQKTGLDVTFIVDVSGSMKTNDQNGMALEMVKAFLDTIHSGDIRMGFVAYSDEIVAIKELTPLSSQPRRDEFKELIDSIPYAGNTDIGLGLINGYELLTKEKQNEERNRVMILISDGESDLKGSTTGRTIEQSEQDILAIVKNSKTDNIPIYTIAFGNYEGSSEVLGRISDETGAESYTAENPDLLMEVLYQILENNMAYRIQQFSEASYSGGIQEIHGILTDKYLDEINVLIISPQEIGETNILYGDKQIPVTKMPHYAVGKISGNEIDDTITEFIILTETSDKQQIKTYILGYRSLEPIINLNIEAKRNEQIPFQLFFRNRDGNIVKDEAFYRQFTWHITLDDEEYPVEIKDGYLQSDFSFSQSGTYLIKGMLTDKLGSYDFDATSITITNTSPEVKELPELIMTVLSKEVIINLADYISDPDGDELQYLLQSEADGLNVTLNGEQLSISAKMPGIHTFTLLISDGEEEIIITHLVSVTPLWREYWWIIALAAVILLILIFKLINRPRHEPEAINDIKSRNHFSGRIDIFFTVLPEQKEIPPLVYSLYKIKESKIRLGDFLKNYPEEAEKLKLNQVYLVADEERKITLFHSAESSIMIGNSIVCRQMRYSVSYGDVIYITSPDGEYDMELHYIAVNK